MRDLIEVNDLKPPYLLKIDQQLALPKPRAHIVRRGETLYRIARRYGFSTTELARLNNLGSPYTIHPGERLWLPGEARLIQTARATRPVIKAPKLAPPARQGDSFAWPLRGRIISGFGPRKDGYRNDGVNIAARPGAAVRAADNGVVVYSGNGLAGYGNLLLLRHADGWVTAYAHNERLEVRRGDQVKRGQIVARAGSTGGVNSPQLHFEIRRGSIPVNPEHHLGS